MDPMKRVVWIKSPKSRRISRELNLTEANACPHGTSMCVERCGVVLGSYKVYLEQGGKGDPPALLRKDDLYWFIISKPMRDRWRRARGPLKARPPKWARSRLARQQQRRERRLGPWLRILGGGYHFAYHALANVMAGIIAEKVKGAA
jgi:hypothetical protein